MEHPSRQESMRFQDSEPIVEIALPPEAEAAVYQLAAELNPALDHGESCKEAQRLVTEAGVGDLLWDALETVRTKRSALGYVVKPSREYVDRIRPLGPDGIERAARVMAFSIQMGIGELDWTPDEGPDLLSVVSPDPEKLLTQSYQGGSVPLWGHQEFAFQPGSNGEPIGLHQDAFVILTCVYEDPEHPTPSVLTSIPGMLADERVTAVDRLVMQLPVFLLGDYAAAKAEGNETHGTRPPNPLVDHDGQALMDLADMHEIPADTIDMEALILQYGDVISSLRDEEGHEPTPERIATAANVLMHRLQTLAPDHSYMQVLSPLETVIINNSIALHGRGEIEGIRGLTADEIRDRQMRTFYRAHISSRGFDGLSSLPRP